MIDDEILRSLKALGLGTEVDIQLALTARKYVIYTLCIIYNFAFRPNVIMVFYRLLEMRKDSQDINNLYPSANRTRNRRNTVSDRETAPSPIPTADGKARSRSLLTADSQPRRHRRSLGIGSSPLPPSPLSGPQHHLHSHTNNNNSQVRGRSGSTSSNSSSESLQFPLTDTNGLHNSQELSPMEPLQLSPANTPPGSPKFRRRQNSYHAPNSHHAPPDAPSSMNGTSSSVPININDKFRRLRLGT